MLLRNGMAASWRCSGSVTAGPAMSIISKRIATPASLEDGLGYRERLPVDQQVEEARRVPRPPHLDAPDAPLDVDVAHLGELEVQYAVGEEALVVLRVLLGVGGHLGDDEDRDAELPQPLEELEHLVSGYGALEQQFVGLEAVEDH